MADIKMSDVRKRLVLKAAQDIRQAVTKRAELLDQYLVRYDQSVKEHDAMSDAVLGDAIVLVLTCSSIMDPVQEAMQRYVQADHAIRDAEDQDVGS